jgi:hypothetical protein
MDCASAGILDGPATGGSGDGIAGDPAGGTDDLDSLMVNWRDVGGSRWRPVKPCDW